MTPFFKSFIGLLNDLDWSKLKQTHEKIEGLLSILDSNREALQDEFKSYTAAERAHMTKRSRELSTHTKWFIYEEPELGYEIWGHEYKSRALIKPGYAVVPHNHVYWFSSLILRGGFEHNVYEVTGITDGEASFQDIDIANKKPYVEGDIYTVNPNMIHSLSNILEPTTTFIVASKAVKLYSEEYNPETRRIIRHDPLLARIQDTHPLSLQVLRSPQTSG